jgi:hypothetical protein
MDLLEAEKRIGPLAQTAGRMKDLPPIARSHPMMTPPELSSESAP